ncbi:MAG: drrA 5, partial [Planctomycetaceae bacterium]|nr:drrA 5 [Planctomycetaceae bacterium]
VVHVQLVRQSPDLADKIRAVAGVIQVDEMTDRLAIRLHEDELLIEDLHDHIHSLGGRIRMFQPEAMDMETAFMKLTEGKTA